MRLFHNTEPEAISKIPCNSQHLNVKDLRTTDEFAEHLTVTKLEPKQGAFTELQLRVYSGED